MNYGEKYSYTKQTRVAEWGGVMLLSKQKVDYEP